MNELKCKDVQGCVASWKDELRRQRDVDRGWAWVVMAAAFVATVIAYGQFLSSGIYFVMFRTAFEESRSATMWVNSVQAAMFSVSGLLANFLLLQFGVRVTCMIGSLTLAASYGLTLFSQSIMHVTICFAFGGAGHSLVTSSIIAAIAKYFEKRLYLATGFVLSGVGVGMIVIGLEIQWAEATFGWRGAMAIQAGVYLQICIFAALVFPIPPKIDPLLSVETEIKLMDTKEPELEPESKQECGDSTAFFADIRFWIQILSSILYLSAFYLNMQILKDLVTFNNPEFAYYEVVLSLGTSLTIGRFCGGFLASCIGPQILNTVAIALYALSPSTFLVIHHSWVPMVGASLIGLSIGLQYPANILVMSVLFGKEHMAILFGYNSLFLGIPTFGIPILTGYVVDKTGSYSTVLFAITAVVLISALLNTANYFIQRTRIKKENNNGH